MHKGVVVMRRGIVAGSQPRGQEDLADEFIAGKLLWVDCSGC